MIKTPRLVDFCKSDARGRNGSAPTGKYTTAKNHSFRSLLAALAVAMLVCVACPDGAEADIFNITVSITSAQNFGQTNVQFDPNQLPPITASPAVFMGTFEASSAAPGPISNLNLVIAGVDIATSFDPAIALEKQNSFNPLTGVLAWASFDNPGAGILGFGSPMAGNFTNFDGAPDDYAAMVINNPSLVPLDPYSQGGGKLSQNWVGTYSVVPVPEPTSLMLLALSGLAVASCRRRA